MESERLLNLKGLVNVNSFLPTERSDKNHHG